MKQSHALGTLAAMLLMLGMVSPIRAQDETYDPEERLAKLGIELPAPPSPVANYVNGVQTGNLIFLAGKGPVSADGTEIRGKLGREISIEQGYAAARITAINQLAVLKAELGDLNRVVRIVKVLIQGVKFVIVLNIRTIATDSNCHHCFFKLTYIPR